MHSLNISLIIAANLIALAIYTGAGIYFTWTLWRKHQIPRTAIMITTAVASIFHGVGIFGLSLASDGFHLSYFGISSLIFWVINLLVLSSSLKKELHNLLLLFPLSSISVLASVVSNSQSEHHLLSYSLATHVILSIIAYSLLTIASLQALLLAYQNHQLKHKHLSGGMRLLPPLQTMEALLFELIFAGELVLTFAIASGFWFLDDMFAQHLAQKTVFSICSWLIYALLLWGRWQLGWRGNKAIRWALAGFVCLMLSYFGSRLVLEFILHRI